MKLRAAPGRHSFTVDTLSLLCTCLRGPTVPGSTVELGGQGGQECHGRVKGLSSSARGLPVGSHRKQSAVGMTGELYFLRLIPKPLPPGPTGPPAGGTPPVSSAIHFYL